MGTTDLAGCEGDGGDAGIGSDGGDASDGSVGPSACEVAADAKGSVGCGFWAVPADDSQLGNGSCFAAAIVNASDAPVAIQADWDGAPLDLSNSVYTANRVSGSVVYTKVHGALAPGGHALVFLSQGPATGDFSFTACPSGVTPAVLVNPIQHGSGRTQAFHIGTSAPVSAYAIFPYGGPSTYYPTATLLRPETSFDTKYLGATVPVFGDPSTAYGLHRSLQIVATQDATEVWGPSNVVPSGAPSSTLGRGEVLQFTEEGLVGGGSIRASKPIGLFGGAPCSFLPGDVFGCDLFQQQLAPLSQWGREYALVPYRSRIDGVEESVPWSLVGAVDGTVLTWTPSIPAGAPDHLAAGQVANFMTYAIASVRSQDTSHPFHASVHMTGGGTSGVLGRGDPDFVVMVPTEQLLDRYTFFVDHLFPDTSLTVVRKKTLGTFRAVNLECAGELSGWQPIGPSADYEYTRVVLTSNFEPQPFSSGTCGYGRHVMSSDGTFSVHVWGTSYYSSYGYPAGLGTRTLNDVALPAYPVP